MAYKGIKIKVGAAEAYDTSEKYGIYVKDFPFLPVPTKQKNIFSQSWLDEDGDDDYIPSEAYYEPISISVPCIARGLLDTCLTNIRAFVAEIGNVEFSVYDTYSKRGFQKCRLVEYSENASVLKRTDSATERVVAQFSLSVKINDPKTQITL